ncbi:MAG TPA: alpha/beta hydrolase [Bacteroidales bacterium]|jgi:pimeloyl-ACP methyl ester carboxylesterase|nr:alpha/beta hydrolase [Bacteroidales bacterium]
MRTIFYITLIVGILYTCDKKTNVHSGFAYINGASLYYEVSGKGKPIVFIHGNFGDRRHWDLQVDYLSRKFMVIRYDVRGFGKSSLPKIDEPYSDQDDLKALLEFLKIEKAHICGLSRGSAVATDFAISYPEMCYSLISAGPWAGGFGSGKFKSASADSMYAIVPKANEILRNYGPKECTDFIWKGNNCLARSVVNPATLNSLLKMGYEHSYWSLLNKSPITSLNPPAMSRLTDIKLPTLIVTAEYDLESCKEIADIMEKEISGSVKVSIKGAGHIMNMDKPLEFNRLISDFVSGIK